MDSFMVIVCLLAVVSILDIVLMYRMIYKLNKRISALEKIVNVNSNENQVVITTADVRRFTDKFSQTHEVLKKDPKFNNFRHYIAAKDTVSIPLLISVIEKTFAEEDR